ncbi:MAG: hypothetical protein KJ899_04760 [Gammaproteobacteria bacterium]|nr:hypothetical protein [Gammaproteobacteria bacterium]
MKKSLFALLFSLSMILPMTCWGKRFPSPDVAVDETPSLGVFDPYWDRDQWMWEDSAGINHPLKHKTLKDCYVEGDQPGEVYPNSRITREKKKLFGSLYEVMRAYDENNMLSEVYYAKIEVNIVLTVFVGKGANKCIAKAEEILRRYESQQTK